MTNAGTAINFERKRFITLQQDGERWQVMVMRWVGEPLPPHWIIADAGAFHPNHARALQAGKSLGESAGIEFVEDITGLEADFRKWFLETYGDDHHKNCEIVSLGRCTCLTYATREWKADHL